MQVSAAAAENAVALDFKHSSRNGPLCALGMWGLRLNYGLQGVGCTGLFRVWQMPGLRNIWDLGV